MDSSELFLLVLFLSLLSVLAVVVEFFLLLFVAFKLISLLYSSSPHLTIISKAADVRAGLG